VSRWGAKKRGRSKETNANGCIIGIEGFTRMDKKKQRVHRRKKKTRGKRKTVEGQHVSKVWKSILRGLTGIGNGKKAEKIGGEKTRKRDSTTTSTKKDKVRHKNERRSKQKKRNTRGKVREGEKPDHGQKGQGREYLRLPISRYKVQLPSRAPLYVLHTQLFFWLHLDLSLDCFRQDVLADL